MSAFAIVNGRSVGLTEALRALWMQHSNLSDKIIENALMRQHAEKLGIYVTDAELQVAADEWRYARGLESVASFRQWMRERQQTELSIEVWLENQLLYSRILQRFTADDIASWYAEHRFELERIDLHSCRVETIDKAEELMELIREGTSFAAVAETHSTDEDTRGNGGHVGSLARSDVAPELESILFNAEVNVPVGPVKSKEGFNLFLITARTAPRLEAIRAEIRST